MDGPLWYTKQQEIEGCAQSAVKELVSLALADDLSRSGCSRVLDVTSPHMHAQARVLTCDDVTYIVSDLIPRAWDGNYIALLRSAHILLSLAPTLQLGNKHK